MKGKPGGGASRIARDYAARVSARALGIGGRSAAAASAAAAAAAATQESNMKISDVFANDYMQTEDFDSSGRVLTIADVTSEVVGKDDKPVIRFKEETQVLPLNRTNAMILAESFGDDTREWKGRSIRLYKDRTQYQGRRVDCLRVMPVDSAA